jgi:stalled ribosome rescue protein Dom34
MKHAIVWIDHSHATVIGLGAPDADDHETHHVARGTGQRHAHAGSPAVDHSYWDAVVAALGTASEVIVAGPGQEKQAFVRDLGKRHAAVARRVVAVETLDHPTEGQLLAHARRAFKRVDALIGDR